jgi:Na+/H+ antiporter NhaA
MRTFRLARIAVEAEGLRLRQRAQRTAIRAAFGMIAMGFLIGSVIFVHLAAWYWIRQTWRHEYAALILGGVDFVLAMVLAFLATRSTPSRVELEALAVRQRAVESAVSSIAVSSLMFQAVRLVSNLVRRPRSR